MKKLFCMYRVGLFCMMLCSMLFMTSCNGNGGASGISGNAPSNVAGKTITIFNQQGKKIWTIEFSSNSSAHVERLFDNDAEIPTNAKYSKTGADSALLELLGNKGNCIKEYSLLFASSNQGSATAGSVQSFTIF